MLIQKKFNFLISSDLNVYRMKCASPSDVMQFYTKILSGYHIRFVVIRSDSGAKDA